MSPCSEEEYYHKLDNMVLTACDHVRKVFIKRWRIETGEGWVDNKEYVRKFLSGPGKPALQKAKTFQRKVLKNKCLAEWDVQLLFLLLHNLGDKEKYKSENDAVYTLKKLRNDLAHHKTKKVPKAEYGQNVNIFKTTMNSLGMEDDEIVKIIEKVGVTSSLRAKEAVTKLYQKAEEFLNKGQIDQALRCYSDAIQMPSLLPAHLGAAHEKRAECLFNTVQSTVSDRDKCDEALLDALKAVHLNDLSWKGHYLAAKCYQCKNDLPKALHHYDRALALSPGLTEVRRNYDSCKVQAGAHARMDHLNPHLQPMNLQERVQRLEQDTGRKLSGKQFLNVHRHVGVVAKGQEHVFQGHRFRQGWGVPQNYNKAAKCYAKAAAVKNAEGMVNLGLCYHHGYGVKQDIEKTLKIYQEVASMRTNTRGEMTPLKCNVGVASAEHALGLLYDQGIGVERDYKEAAKWYQRAMEHGVGHAANNLGLLYFKGLGVPRDEKMGEYCLKEAVNLGSVNAPATLVGYYLEEIEPDKAEEMGRIAKKMENADMLSGSEEDFSKVISSVRAQRAKLEPEVLDFERTHNLTIKGLTFRERCHRRLRSVDPDLEKLAKILENKSKTDSCGGKNQGFDFDDVMEIEDRAREGSSTAYHVMITLTCCLEMNIMLESPLKLSKDGEREVLDLLYTCVTLNHHLLFGSEKSRRKLRSIVSKRFRQKCASPGEDDMTTRLCYVAINLSGSMKSEDDMYGVELLREGIRRYPDDHNYYWLLSALLGNKKMYQEGRSVAEQGLEKFPDSEDLLYSRAVHIENCPWYANKGGESIAAYKAFLSGAPIDHRKVPEACYNIAFLYLFKKEMDERDISADNSPQVCQSLALSYWKDISPEKRRDLEQSQAYFLAGLELEGFQLPCHLPYGESQAKFLSGLFFKMKNRGRMLGFPVKEEESVLERKKYLKSPTRKVLILQHRENLKKGKDITNKRDRKYFQFQSKTPKLKQEAPKKMCQVRPITLVDMNPAEDHIFENRSLELTILEEPNTQFKSIHLIAEDDNGDVTRLYIYNVDKTPENVGNFEPGCRIAILNPYMRIGAQDVTNGIRNDEPKCIVYLEGVESMCRFCGEGNASLKCSECGRPYCSKECQVLEWKMFQHKLICGM